jgi:hypothetical protein
MLLQVVLLQPQLPVWVQSKPMCLQQGQQSQRQQQQQQQLGMFCCTVPLVSQGSTHGVAVGSRQVPTFSVGRGQGLGRQWAPRVQRGLGALEPSPTARMLLLLLMVVVRVVLLEPAH